MKESGKALRKMRINGSCRKPAALWVVRSKFIKRVERLLRRGLVILNKVKTSPDSEIYFQERACEKVKQYSIKLKSLILAQIERWRHA